MAAPAVASTEESESKNGNVEKQKDEIESLQTKEEEELGGLDDDEPQMITIRSGAGHDDEPKAFDISTKCASLSSFIGAILEGDSDATYIEARQADAETLGRVVEYLQHHDGKVPDEMPCPVRSKHMKDIVSDPWDAKWIDSFKVPDIFKVILAANYMDIKPLLHLGCAKIATIIKALPQKEVNEIIAEEEAYQEAEKERKKKEESQKEKVDDDVKDDE